MPLLRVALHRGHLPILPSGEGVILTISPPVLYDKTDPIVPDRFFAMDDMTRATFAASIPPLQSAIRTGGDGMRITIEVPESEMGQAVKLIAMRGKRLKVTIEVMQEADGKTWGR